MDERRLEAWGSGLLLIVALMVGGLVLAAQRAGAAPTLGPPWLWWACYLGFLAAAVLAFWPNVVRWLSPPVCVAAMAAFAAACVLTGPQGWTPILLVFSASIAAHLVSRRAVAGLIATNSAVLLAFVPVHGMPVGEAVAFAAMYGVLQALSVWAVLLQRSEADARQRLAVVNTELRAATALLAESSRSAERLRISRDLHDVVGHQLTALALELEVAAHKSTGPAAAHVARARGLAKELLGDVRAAVGELRDRPAELTDALREVVADLPRPRIHLDVDEDLIVDADRVATLVRCVQEVVTNTIRHAQADRLEIEVRAGEDGEVVLTAVDDGVGTSALALGNGLTGLRERVDQLGGTVRFQGRPGFRVDVVLPEPAGAGPSAAADASAVSVPAP